MAAGRGGHRGCLMVVLCGRYLALVGGLESAALVGAEHGHHAGDGLPHNIAGQRGGEEEQRERGQTHCGAKQVRNQGRRL